MCFLTPANPKVSSKVKYQETITPPSLSECDGSVVSLFWDSGLHSRFHSSWLRHNCHCADCKQEGSGQKCLDAAHLPDRLTISEVVLKGDKIELRWREEPNHFGYLPLQFLKDNSYDESTLTRKQVDRRPHAYQDEGMPRVRFSDVRASTDGLFSMMSMVHEFGMCLVEDMRTARGGAIERFDVVSTPDPINIAYSSVRLDLHMDLAYYESPPGLQVFNCVRFDNLVVGGESIFLDVFPLMEDFRSTYPQEFEDLARIPATFQKIHFNRVRPVYMTYQRPHVAINADKEITGVFWSPAFEGPLSVPEKDVELYYRAYPIGKGHQRITLTENYPSKSGEAIVFNNRRILHGRNEFSLNGGQRHFEGCYMNIDEFLSHFRFLSHSKGRLTSVKRVGNQCWF
ncbi:LOW QUALITY PROTEIN: probable gamma-butyrobetaine dioxygenase [Liolophura sinensis]|uniref:LOW QUALITY PROTEIN: probable gamma-butyrobetaine dioxygenase n=1 Tax=Liolophura sinensis TaxID=3198878 RepID=UPI0031595128